MPKTYPAKINPEMLRWSREYLSFSQVEISKKLNMSTKDFSQIENGTREISLSKLRALAKIYNQSIAFYFFNKPPKKPKIGNDFRIVYNQEIQSLMPKTLQKIMKVIEKRKILLENELDYYNEIYDYSWIGSVKDFSDYKTVASQIRNFLEITIENQLSWKSDIDPFNIWRDALEKKGIMVFYIREVDLEQLRGYAYTQTPLPFVLINNKDVRNAQIFTLIHELCHLFANSNGYCNPYGQTNFKNNEEIETFANYVTGEVLVPTKALMSINDVYYHKIEEEWTLESIKNIANLFKVSREVIFRRLVINGKATIDQYNSFRNVLYKSLERTKITSPGGNFWNTYRSEYSSLFIDSVRNSLKNRKLTILDTAYLLSLKRNLLHNIIPDIHKYTHY